MRVELFLCDDLFISEFSEAITFSEGSRWGLRGGGKWEEGGNCSDREEGGGSMGRV